MRLSRSGNEAIELVICVLGVLRGQNGMRVFRLGNEALSDLLHSYQVRFFDSC